MRVFRAFDVTRASSVLMRREKSAHPLHCVIWGADQRPRGDGAHHVIWQRLLWVEKLGVKFLFHQFAITKNTRLLLKNCIYIVSLSTFFSLDIQYILATVCIQTHFKAIQLIFPFKFPNFCSAVCCRDPVQHYVNLPPCLVTPNNKYGNHRHSHLLGSSQLHVHRGQLAWMSLWSTKVQNTLRQLVLPNVVLLYINNQL